HRSLRVVLKRGQESLTLIRTPFAAIVLGRRPWRWRWRGGGGSGNVVGNPRARSFTRPGQEVSATAMYVPKQLFFTKGVGTHCEKLTSFELALRDAKIACYNLVRVSSIFPPHCEEVSIE